MLIPVPSDWGGMNVRRATNRTDYCPAWRAANPLNMITNVERTKTGIPGLDNILSGGLIANRLYLVNGDPGSGKTTLALHYLMEGVRLGEKCLYITLSETKEELVAGAV